MFARGNQDVAEARNDMSGAKTPFIVGGGVDAAFVACFGLFGAALACITTFYLGVEAPEWQVNTCDVLLGGG